MQFRAHGPLGQIYLVGCVIGLQSLVACSAQGDRFSLNVLSQAQSVPLGQALIVPPPGGPAVIGVTQTAYENGLEQNVLLATNSAVPGQNEFTVRALKDEPADNQTVVLGEERLQPERIGEELEERFPGVDMQVSLLYVQNKYGPFGFAIGQPRPGEQCLYAWQRIDRGERPILSYEGGSVSVRLRLCETGRTPTELLRTAYGYTFVGYSRAVGWNPLGEPPAPSPALGATSTPIYPAPPRGTFDDALPPRVERAERARAARPARPIEPWPAPTVIEAPPVNEPLPGYPTVPAPAPAPAPAKSE